MAFGSPPGPGPDADKPLIDGGDDDIPFELGDDYVGGTRFTVRLAGFLRG